MRTTGRHRRTRGVITLLIASLIGGGGYQSATADVTPTYVPGSAVAAPLGYDVGAWSKTYLCSYAGWVSAEKYWECDLHTYPDKILLASHGGSWSGSGKITPTYYRLGANQLYFLHAAAGYNNGSGSDSEWRAG